MTPQRRGRFLTLALYVVFAGASAALLARTFAGPFHFVLPVRSPLNAEGLAAVSFLLAMLARALPAPEAAVERMPAPMWALMLAAGAAAVVCAFAPNIGVPLLHDSYIHVARSLSLDFPALLRAALIRPLPEELFFRPVGYLSYWIDAKWAGSEPALWRSWNLGLHLVNSGLVLILARRLGLTRLPATVAALVFALHGGRPEVVSWVAARFDLLATFFTLAALLTVRRTWLVAVLAGLAVMSKEAAFALPLLIASCAAVRPPEERRRIMISAAAAAGVCGLVLLWRSHYIGGVGGYVTASGAPSVFRFSALLSAKALFYRQWAILFFPINWSREPGLVLETGILAMTAAAAAFLRFSRGSRRMQAFSLAFVVVSVLPAQHLLLIGSDLSGVRVLYLPMAGMALFWGFAAEGCRWKPARMLLPAGLLFFHAAVLEHNLAIWRDVAMLSQRTCRDLGLTMRADQRAVSVRNLPATREGVFFLSNGFPQCVQLNTGVSEKRVDTDGTPPGARVFEWSDTSTGLREVPGPAAH